MPAAGYPAPTRVSNFASAQAINPSGPFTLQWSDPADATTNDVPDLLAARLTLRPFHSQGDRVVAALGVLVDRVLLRRAAPVAEIPLPGRHLARGLIAERHHPPVQIDSLETPVGLELAEFGLQRHQPECHQFVGLPV